MRQKEELAIAYDDWKLLKRQSLSNHSKFYLRILFNSLLASCREHHYNCHFDIHLFLGCLLRHTFNTLLEKKSVFQKIGTLKVSVGSALFTSRIYGKVLATRGSALLQHPS
ncbi:hypothetical protein LMQOC1_50003 [Listeria monocytogenes QOC1]|nr:hypothetical protein LMQOC1_50003 [Listeria monocytogenes QOC1]